MHFLTLAALALPALALAEPKAAPFAHVAFPAANEALDSLYGRAVSPTLSPDGSCGVVGLNVYTCQGSAYGRCCGHDGLCGIDATTCSVASGCNALYGLCDGVAVPSPSVGSRQNPAFTNSSSAAITSPTPGGGNRNPGGPFSNATMSSNTTTSSTATNSGGGRSGSQGPPTGGPGSGMTITGPSINPTAPGRIGTAYAPPGSVCFLYTTMVPVTDNTTTTTSSSTSSSSATGSDAGRSGSATTSSATDTSTSSDTSTASTTV